MKLSDTIDKRADTAYRRAFVRYCKAYRLMELADKDYRDNFGIMRDSDRIILRLARRLTMELSEP